MSKNTVNIFFTIESEAVGPKIQIFYTEIRSNSKNYVDNLFNSDLLILLNNAIKTGIEIKIETTLLASYNKSDISAIVDVYSNYIILRRRYKYSYNELYDWSKDLYFKTGTDFSRLTDNQQNGLLTLCNMLGTVQAFQIFSSLYAELLIGLNRKDIAKKFGFTNILSDSEANRIINTL